MSKSENIKLSFIIPVYNVEKYLNECVDSIVNQINEECEIILVNDGSTDLSGKICVEYAEKYSFVKVFHKENTGVADSRNFGLKQAVGKYVAFVDSDDFIAEQTINKVIDWINEYNVDVCFLNAVKWYSNSKEEKIDDFFDRDEIYNREAEEVLSYLSTKEKYPGSSWGKLFRREFLLDLNIIFPTKRKHGEDLTFVRKVLLNARSFDYLPILFYKYRQGRIESVTHSVNDRSFFDIYKFIYESVEDCDSIKKIAPVKYNSFMNFVAYEYCILLWQIQYVSKEKKQEAKKIVSEYEWLLNYSKINKVNKIYAIKKIFGLDLTSKILYIYMKLRK